MIYVIGIGAGGRTVLSERTEGLISGSSLLAGGRRHLEDFPDFPGRRVAVSGGLRKVASALERCLERGEDASVLATGDPLLFGIGSWVVRTFGPDRVEIIPGVSTAQEAFARARLPWDGARVLTVHGRGGGAKGAKGKGGKGGEGGEGDGRDGIPASVADEIIAAGKAAVFTDPVNTPADVARAVIDRAGDGAGYRAWVCSELGTDRESVDEYTLKALARKRRFPDLNVLVIAREGAKEGGREAEAPSSSPSGRAFGFPDSEFDHEKGLITRSEVRAVVLSKLSLRPDSVVWDVGAGCGSVAVEAARLAPRGRVYAFEKRAGRVKTIRENARAFGAENLEAVGGEAPGSIKGRKLPAPDSAFIGGGGAGLKDILGFVSRRLRKGGTAVATAVTVESSSVAVEFFKRNGWDFEAVLLGTTRSRPLGGLTFMEAENQVWVISARKPL